jgi:hypothetical protein
MQGVTSLVPRKETSKAYCHGDGRTRRAYRSQACKEVANAIPDAVVEARVFRVLRARRKQSHAYEALC